MNRRALKGNGSARVFLLASSFFNFVAYWLPDKMLPIVSRCDDSPSFIYVTLGDRSAKLGVSTFYCRGLIYDEFCD